MRGSLTKSSGYRLQLEQAQVSLIGARETNQDRAGAALSPHAAMAFVCDGMGGHSDGERAAIIAEQVLNERFHEAVKPLLDPLGFLHLAIGAAHESVARHGLALPVEVRPRATCALCLVQDGSAYWAHVGDSRIYHLRAGKVLKRTRDHSHIELLLREGLIAPEEMQGHPMRNFVESCIGGEALLPEMSIGMREPLQPGDVLLVCSDGLWGNLDDEELARVLTSTQMPLAVSLAALAERAVTCGGAAADNTSAVVLRCLG